jgi:hypothetical protein
MTRHLKLGTVERRRRQRIVLTGTSHLASYFQQNLDRLVAEKGFRRIDGTFVPFPDMRFKVSSICIKSGGAFSRPATEP